MRLSYLFALLFGAALRFWRLKVFVRLFLSILALSGSNTLIIASSRTAAIVVADRCAHYVRLPPSALSPRRACRYN